MRRVLKVGACFAILAGLGILLGCYVHGVRTNQPTIMSGFELVRELPHGVPVAEYLGEIVRIDGPYMNPAPNRIEPDKCLIDRIPAEQ